MFREKDGQGKCAIANHLRMKMRNRTNWLIGSGYMASAYFEVLKYLKQDVLVIGRGEATAKAFEEKNKHPVIRGGLDKYLASDPKVPECCFLTVDVDYLYDNIVSLLKFGVKKILVEKPGALFQNEINEIAHLSKLCNATICVAYNRRFYSSTRHAREIIEQDGGVVSFNFEITELSQTIDKLNKSRDLKERWLIGNTSHLIDLAFNLGGKPKEINTFTHDSLTWHPSAAIFAGFGLTHADICFSYHGNWKSPGRWSLDILTAKNRLIFKPLEELKVMKQGSFTISEVPLMDNYDRQFKPGIFHQLNEFLSGNYDNMCSIYDQMEMFGYYEKIAGYDKNVKK